MDVLRQEASKLVQAQMREPSADDATAAVAQAGAKEHVRRVAVDMAEIARRMGTKNGGKVALEQLAATQRENEKKEPREALALHGGSPLSMFDPAAFPAAFTEFLFGDCVPLLKRETPVTCQQVFAALLSREELEYSLADKEGFKASEQSRFDTPESCSVFMSFLRSTKTLQSCKAAFDRQGSETDIKHIASATSEDFVAAALRESQPRSNQDVLRNVANERVRSALRHLGFSSAMVLFTDGHKMRLHHLGCAMNTVFGPLAVFHTHNYADNCCPEIPKLLPQLGGAETAATSKNAGRRRYRTCTGEPLELRK